MPMQFPALSPVKARNMDGTVNKAGTIESYVDLSFKIGNRKCQNRFYVTGLGKQRIILGFPWLQEHNPKIDWQTGSIEWQTEEQPNIETKLLLDTGLPLMKITWNNLETDIKLDAHRRKLVDKWNDWQKKNIFEHEQDTLEPE